MLEFFRENPRAFVAAVLVHLVLLGVLVFSLDWTPTVSLKGNNKDAPVQAVVIDSAKVDAEVERQQQIEQEKAAAEQRRVQELQRQADAAKAAREQEARKAADLKAQQEAEQRKADEARKQAALEAQRKAEAEAQAKRQAEAQRKAEDEARKKAEAEAKRKAEEDAKRQAEEAARKKAEAEKQQQAEDALAASLAEEESRLSAQRAAASQRAVNENAALIKAKVQRNWIRPVGSSDQLSCLVAVRLIPSGEVVGVNIVRGSGDDAFDRSVQAAVYKASPLPVPQDPALMDQFRSFSFEFKSS